MVALSHLSLTELCRLPLPTPRHFGMRFLFASFLFFSSKNYTMYNDLFSSQDLEIPCLGRSPVSLVLGISEATLDLVGF